jgi:uncharacterized membrane protein
MSGAIPPLPQYAFMAWCLVKKYRNNFTFTHAIGLRIGDQPITMSLTIVVVVVVVVVIIIIIITQHRTNIRGRFEKFVDWQQCAAVMQREAVTLMPSCSGEDNVVVV